MKNETKHTWEADQTNIHGRKELVARLFLLQNPTYAAAPELLADGKNAEILLTELMTMYGKQMPKGLFQGWLKTVNALRAAIAKAEVR